MSFSARFLIDKPNAIDRMSRILMLVMMKDRGKQDTELEPPQKWCQNDDWLFPHLMRGLGSRWRVNPMGSYRGMWHSPLSHVKNLTPSRSFPPWLPSFQWRTQTFERVLHWKPMCWSAFGILHFSYWWPKSFLRMKTLKMDIQKYHKKQFDNIFLLRDF